MVSKNTISRIRKLHTKKFRDESGLFLVEGYKSVEMLSRSDFLVEEIFATENAVADNAASGIHSKPSHFITTSTNPPPTHGSFAISCTVPGAIGADVVEKGFTWRSPSPRAAGWSSEAVAWTS